MSSTATINETQLFDPTSLKEVEAAIKGLKFNVAFRLFINNVSVLEGNKFDIQDFISQLNLELRWFKQYLTGEKIPLLKTLEKMKTYFAQKSLVFDPLLELAREELRVRRFDNNEEEEKPMENGSPIVASAAKLVSNLSNALQNVGATVEPVKIDSTNDQTKVSTQELAKLVEQLNKAREDNKKLSDTNLQLTKENADFKGQNSTLANVNSNLSTQYQDLFKDHKYLTEEVKEMELAKREAEQKIQSIEQRRKEELALLEAEFATKKQESQVEADRVQATYQAMLDRMATLEAENKQLKALKPRGVGLINKEGIIELAHASTSNLAALAFGIDLPEMAKLSNFGHARYRCMLENILNSPEMSYEDNFNLSMQQIKENCKDIPVDKVPDSIDDFIFSGKVVDRYAFDLMQILVKML